MPSLRGILFDLDGTLVDSAEDLRAALNLMLGDLGLRAVTRDEIKSMIGDGVAKLVERALVATGGDLARQTELVARFMGLYEANATTLTLCYPGVADTLHQLQQRHFILGVVTNKPVMPTRQILRALSLDRFFSAIVGGDSLPQRKPHPAPLLEAARQLALAADQILMVGDNIHDIEAARAARMRCVAVSYGYHHRPPAEFHADHLIDRFEDLVPLVDRGASRVARSTSDADDSNPNPSF